MRLGRLTFSSHRFLHSTVGLAAVVVLAVYSGGSVPDDLRRYIVTPQELSNSQLADARASHITADWKPVGNFVAEQGLLDSMNGRERALVRAAYSKETQAATADNAIRQRIRVPLLPGPVKTAAVGPIDRPVAPTAPAAPVAAAPKTTATPAVAHAPATPLAEDLATIEALKAALKDLKADGLLVGNYRNDVADQ